MMWKDYDNLNCISEDDCYAVVDEWEMILLYISQSNSYEPYCKASVSQKTEMHRTVHGSRVKLIPLLLWFLINFHFIIKYLGAGNVTILHLYEVCHICIGSVIFQTTVYALVFASIKFQICGCYTVYKKRLLKNIHPRKQWQRETWNWQRVQLLLLDIMNRVCKLST